MSFRIKEALIKSARELGERIFVRKRCKTAGILCVFQGFTNAFLAEIIRQDPKTHLISASLCSASFTFDTFALQVEASCFLQEENAIFLWNGSDFWILVKMKNKISNMKG